jgi:hypothetical protein
MVYLGPLPVGSWLILLNCVIYGFTSRLDRAATLAASKEVYYMYGRLIMAATTLGGSAATGRLTERNIAPFFRPKVMSLRAAACLVVNSNDCRVTILCYTYCNGAF